LLSIAASPTDAKLKPRVIQALIEVNSRPDLKLPDTGMRQLWLQILWRCDTPELKIMVVDGLAKFRAPWANELIAEVSRSSDAAAAQHAKKVLETQK
jgi:hypothetical protein